MAAVVSLLIIITFSLLVVRIATVALTMTGLSTESARFQARSAFTGTGFTTGEAESIVNHPVRRRIVALLMIMQSAGLVTVISSLILSFVNVQGTSQGLYRFFWILGGIVILLIISYSKWIDRHLSKVIHWCLTNWTKLEVRDYYSILHLQGDYRVNELEIEPEDWIAEKSLQKMDLLKEGVLVLGVERAGGDYIGAPTGKCKLHPGDKVILYGKKKHLKELDQRRSDHAGEQAHREAIATHEEQKKSQSKKEA